MESSSQGRGAEPVSEAGKRALFEYFRRRLESGSTDMYEGLAECYEKGEGVERDERKAMELLQRAVDMGSSHALVSLGYRFENGRCGVEADKRRYG